MPYIPHTEEDKKEMLESIGVKNFDELLNDIPSGVRLERLLNLPDALSELEILRLLTKKANKNTNLNSIISFLGAGIYDHYIPSVVNHITNRPEFYTAYTPYQAEVSQGTLQAIYEYQSLISEITSMDAANASMYDGASATAEAALLAYNAKRCKKKEIIIVGYVHPYYKKVIETYTMGYELKITYLRAKDGIAKYEVENNMMRQK